MEQLEFSYTTAGDAKRCDYIEKHFDSFLKSLKSTFNMSQPFHSP